MEDEQKPRNLEWFFEQARRILTVSAAIGILGGGVLFMLDHPWITNKVASMAGTEELSSQIAESNSAIDVILKKVEGLEIFGLTQSIDPVIEFALDGNAISDGDIGQLVVFDIGYRQLKNCGRPAIVAGFRNGQQIIHTFQDVSIVGPDGRSFASPAHPEEILRRRFTARIPDNSGVQYGSAIGWIEFGPYPQCPNAPTGFSPRMPFQIKKAVIDLRNEGPEPRRE